MGLASVTEARRIARDGTKVDSLLYAGNNLDKARRIYERAIKRRPRIRLTIRQRTRVLDQWPQKSGRPSLLSLTPG
jgi:hypothetical protein